MEFTSFMDEALIQAKEAALKDEVPIGAVIIDPSSNKIISRAHNLVETTKDASAHAEIIAIRRACKILNTNKLTDLDIYSTLEPCSMCATAISLSRINRLYFGASDPKSGGVINGAKIFTHTHHKPEFYHGIYEEESSKLITQFFQNKR